MALDAALRASIAATTVAAVATESAAVTTCTLATRAICTGTGNTVGRFLLHRKANALLAHVNCHDAHFHDVTHGKHSLRIFHELVADFRNVHEAVLVNADIHECTEVCHVGHDTFHPATRNQVLNRANLVVELGVAEFLTRVAARLLEFLDDIVQGRLTHFVGEKFFEVDCLHGFGVTHHVLHRDACLLGHLFDESVVFGVNGGIVQRVFGTRNAHKAGSLFKGLRAEALHVLQGFAASVGTVFFAVFHDGFGQSIAKACHVRKQRSRSAVHVYTDHVHAAFHHFVQAFLEFALVHVVLVLAHANGLRVHLHQFGQRVLQTAANGDGATGRHVFLREFLDSNHACAVNRSTCFAHDYARRNLALELGGHFGAEGVRLAASGTVTDCNQVNLVLVDKAHQVHGGTGLVVPRFVRFDNAVVHELAVFVEHGHLAPRTETRVEGEHGLVAGRCCEQHILQVLAEHLEGFFFGSVLEHQAHFAFHARLEQAFPGILAHGFQVRSPGGVALDNLLLEVTDHFFVRHFDRKAEHLFLFATAQREHTVARNLRYRFAKVVVILELGFLTFEILLDLRNHDAGLFHLVTQVLTEFGIVGHFFGQNVGGTLEGGLRVGKALFFGQVNQRNLLGGVAGFFLSPHQAGQGLQAQFLRDGGAGALLGLVRSVNIFEEGLVLTGFDLGLEFGSQLALFFDTLEHGFFAVHKFLQVIAAVADIAQLDFVQRARLVLTVAGDKGDSTTLVHQLERLGDAPYFKVKLFGNNCRKIHNVVPFFMFGSRVLPSWFHA